MRTSPTFVNPTYAGTITRAPDSTTITGGFSAEL